MSALSWPSKDPNEVLDFGLDWTAAFNSEEVIVASLWEVPPGLIVLQEGFDSRAAVIWLAGGADATVYVLVNRVTTSQGRTYDQSVRLKAKSR